MADGAFPHPGSRWAQAQLTVVSARYGLQNQERNLNPKVLGEEDDDASFAKVGNSLTVASDTGDFAAVSSGSAEAGVGHLHASATASATGSTTACNFGGGDNLCVSSGSAVAGANAGWLDKLKFESTGEPDGAQVTIHAAFRFHGSTSDTGSATPNVNMPVDPQADGNIAHVSGHISQAGGSSSVDFGGSGTADTSIRNMRLGADGLPSETQQLNNKIPVTLSEVVGQEFDVNYSLSVSASGSGASGLLPGDNFIGSGAASFGETVAWDGITSVTDNLTGALITDWTVTSHSGFDYSKPFVEVPEPSAIALAAVALGGMALLFRSGRERFATLV